MEDIYFSCVLDWCGNFSRFLSALTSLKAFWSLGSGCQSWSLWPVLATAQWIPCRAKQVKPLACIISHPIDIIFDRLIIWCSLSLRAESMFWAFPVGPGIFSVLSCAAPQPPKLSQDRPCRERPSTRSYTGRLFNYVKVWNHHETPWYYLCPKATFQGVLSHGHSWGAYA